MAISDISLPNERSVSYVITAYNKAKYVRYLLDSFVEEGGAYEREYIVLMMDQSRVVVTLWCV